MATVKDDTRLQEFLDKRQYWWWAEQARTPRIDYLRKAVWSKASKGSSWLPGIKFCEYGPILYAEAFSTMEATVEPYMLTWAKALALVDDKMPIFIVDKSKIVGNCASAPHKIFWVSNGAFSINEDFYNDQDDLLDEDQREPVAKAMEIMKPYTQQYMCERVLSKRQKIMARTAQTYTGGPHVEGSAYCTSNFEYYKKGYNAIIEEIDGHLDKANEVLYKLGGRPDFKEEKFYFDRIDNWKAMKLVLQSGIRHAKRLARLARIIAENFETDPERRQELLDIGDRCEHVPANKARTFLEVLQFEHIQTQCRKREKPDQSWPSHPDWWFDEWFQKDIKDGTMTRDEALEYVCEYLIRAFEYGAGRDRQHRELSTGDPGPFVWTLGGMAPSGELKYTDLTNIFLEAARLVRTVSPTFALRYNKDMPEDVLRNAFECIRHGLGYPNMRNDRVLTEANMYWSNTPIEEARTWTAQACIVPCPETKNGCMPARYSASALLGSKAVELALWNGYNPVFNMQVGPKTGDVTKMTFDELFDAVIEQFKTMHWQAAKMRNIARCVEQIQGKPHLSATYERCVEAGLNCFQTYEYGNNWLSSYILMDGLDALAGLRRLVYDDKKYTMAQVLEMLKANWEGYEKERMDFVKAPKWGNDDPYVDDMVVKIHERIRDEVCMPAQCWGTTAKGIPHVPQCVAAFTLCSVLLGALPNGRRLGDTCYDGGCSPGAGLDKKGPTAVLNSVGKLTHENMFRANLLNQRISPAQLVGDKGFELWNSYMKAWDDLGINHVQFNCVDNETLLAAQKEPEEYNELVVRVAGYSANFTSLNRKTQDTIIARTIQEI